jgi:phosphoribosylformylglycinamidine synthase
MLSESQERMLIVAAKGREREVVDIFKKWELDAVVIGHVTADGHLRVKTNGQIVADIPNSALTEEAPVYRRPISKPEATPTVEIQQLEKSNSELQATFMRIIAQPTIASKEWVYRQYDHMVRTNTVVPPGSDAAVIRVKEKRRGIAMTLDSNARYCQIDPRAGTKLVVAEACRNLVVSGARPLALTNCLNFGSPERPEVMWQFSEVIDGMTEACTAFGTPVTGGNVSFYNETDGQGIYPTPVIGMVGIVEDPRHITTQWFKQEDRAILLLGSTSNDLGTTEYEVTMTGELRGRVPEIDLDLERRVQEACLKSIQAGLVESAHDCSDGGLIIALAECCFSSYRRDAIGCEVSLNSAKSSGAPSTNLSELSSAALLFAETPSRIILSSVDANVDQVVQIARENNVPLTGIGRTRGERIKVDLNGERLIDLPITEVEQAWRGHLAGILQK